MVDFTALNTFKNVDLGNDNAIVNINDDKQLTSDSTFSKAKIFRFLRSSTTQANNNQIRTELLKSLGKAFGLEQGIGTGPKGEVTFSREFMDRLEKILGPAFKRSDFGVPAEGGAVKSGKPLTQRRINLIMTQAAAFESKDFSIASYKNKLSVIMKDLGMPDTVGMKKTDLDVKFKDNPVARIFADIQRSLDFLENELDTAIKNDEGFEFYLETAANEEERETIINNTDKKFLMKDPNSGEYIKYSNVEGSGFRDAILWPKLGGELIHTERAKFRPETSTDIKPLKDYIANTIKAFVKNGIDCYMEAKMSGKMNQFVDHVTHKVGACMEDKGKNFIEFRQKHLEEGVVDKKLEAELDSIINRNKAETQKQYIEAELNELIAKNPDGDWPDYATQLKDKLVGKNATVIVAKENENTGRMEYTELKENGKPVVRPLTAEDIDKLGEAIYNDVLGL